MDDRPGTLFELPSQRIYSIDIAKAEVCGFMRGNNGRIMDEAIRKGES